MSKTVKLSDENHQVLDDIRTKHESYNDVVTRLIRVFQGISSMVTSLSPDVPAVRNSTVDPRD